MIPAFEPTEVWPENEECPYRVLPCEVYDTTMDEVESRLVHDFPDSNSRPKIYNGLSRLQKDAANRGLSMLQWMGGSYVSTKTDPGDVDVFTVAHYELVNNLDIHGRTFVERWLAGRANSVPYYSTHAFYYSYYPPEHEKHQLYESRRRYWRKWFGHTREIRNPADPTGPLLPGAPKGILAIKVGEPTAIPPVSTDLGGAEEVS